MGVRKAVRGSRLPESSEGGTSRSAPSRGWRRQIRAEIEPELQDGLAENVKEKKGGKNRKIKKIIQLKVLEKKSEYR